MKNRERGAVLFIMVVTLPLIFALAWYVINIVHGPVVKTQVQSVADSAAHAGTFVLDPRDPSTWEKSRSAVLSTLEALSGQVGGLLELVDTMRASPFETEVTSSDGLMTLIIKRGRYIPGFSSGDISEFESLEDEDTIGKETLRAIRSRIANAVNVKIELTRGPIFAPSFMQGALALGGTSVVTDAVVTFANYIEMVPPFAMPLCSLIEGTSTFEPSRICASDRLMAVPEHARGFENMIPDFQYDPGAASNVQVKCVWDSPQYNPWGVNPYIGDMEDNFGVIGLPGGAGSEVSLQSVYNALTNNSTGGLIEARIGQRFVPMKNFDRSVTNSMVEGIGDRIWKLITNVLGYGADRNPTFESALGPAVGSASARIQPNWVPYHAGVWGPSCGGGLSPAQQNLCGSRRFRWDCSEGDPKSPDNVLGVVGSEITPGPTTDTVWQVKVPLIAEVDNEGRVLDCASGAWVERDREYRIVGFVRMNVYDTDFGASHAVPRPALQVRVSDDPSRYTADTAGTQFPLSVGTDQWVPTCSGSRQQFIPSPPQVPAAPYSCGVVRTRVDCETTFGADKVDLSGNPIALRIVK